MIENLQLDFNPFGRNRKNINRAAITGMTLTVYDSRWSVTSDVLEALNNPKTIGILYEPALEAFMVGVDPEGPTTERKNGSGKQFSDKRVKADLIKAKGCDFNANFYRLVHGRRYGKFVLFSTDDMIEVKRETRNGSN